MSWLFPLQYAWRSLRRSPAFTTASVVTLALGIGATSAIFTVVNSIVLRPLPYRDPDRLVGLWHALPGVGLPQSNQTAGTYFVYRRFSHLLENIGVYTADAVNFADPRGSAEPRRVRAGLISASVLPVLGVVPILGRAIAESEDRPNAAKVMLIGEGLWRRQFGADPAVIGRMVQINGRAREVIGVMPASFHFPEKESEVWLPLALDPAATITGGFNNDAVGRLRAGATPAAVEAEMTRLLPRWADLYPFLAPGITTASVIAQTKIRPIVHPMREDVIGNFAQVLWVIAGTAGLVLLVACANVANLLLVRAEGRQREVAVRTALGASPARVLGLFMSEGIVLAVIGGVVGLALAAAGVRLLVRFGPADIPRLGDVGLDGASLAFTGFVTLLVALQCSLLPSVRFGSVSLAAVLKESGRSGTAGRSRHRVRGALVSAQVALALVLLASSGVLARSFWRLQAVRPGFDPAHVLTLWLELPGATYPHLNDVARFYAQAVDRISALPGVRAAGTVSKLPLQNEAMNLNPVWVEGANTPAGAIPPIAELAAASGGYFKAMGIPLLAGRTFGPPDGAQSPYDVVVSRSFADIYLHDRTGQAALGRRFHTIPTTTWYTIIGVVESVRDTALEFAAPPMVYAAAVAAPDSVYPSISHTMGLVVRTAGDPRAAVASVQREIHALDPALPIFNLRLMEEVVAHAMARTTFTLVVLGVAATVTLMLGAIGLYGVIAYVVSLRTREIGVRIALGAQPGQVSRLVARQGLVLAAIGIGAGLVAFALVAPFLHALLFDVSATDPMTLVAVSGLLLVVAVLASWLPANRAGNISPLEALRAE